VTAVVTDECRGCGACLLTCPTHAFRPVHSGAGAAATLLVIDQLCNDCGECAEICPADAIEVPL
jgi:electron transport complex protein RnfB